MQDLRAEYPMDKTVDRTSRFSSRFIFPDKSFQLKKGPEMENIMNAEQFIKEGFLENTHPCSIL